MQLNKVFQNLGMAGSVAEMVTLVLVILALSLVFWLLVSRYRLHNFLINTYISLALVSVIPQEIMSFTKNSYILLFVLFVVFLTLMNKYLFDIYQSGPSYAMWKAFIMSFLEVILILSIIFSNLPSKDALTYISKNSLAYFVDPWWRLAWMVLPLVFLILVKKRER